MIEVRLAETQAERDALLEPARVLAREAESNLTFHQLPVPMAWWKQFHSEPGEGDFGSKRMRNFLGMRSRLEECFFAAAESDGKLVGLAPLAVFSVTVKSNAPPLKVLCFCADSVTVFYQDLLIHPGNREDTLAALLDFLCAHAEKQNMLLFLGYIPEDSPNLPGLKKAAEARLQAGWKGGLVTNRYRGGVYPWTLHPLDSALAGLKETVPADAALCESIEALKEKLGKQGPTLLTFQATRKGLEQELESLLGRIPAEGAPGEAARKAREAIASDVIIYPHLKLPASVEEFQQTLSSSRRYYFRRYLKKFLEANGSFEDIAPADLSSADVEEYLALHRQRWGSDSVAVNDSTIDFHRQIAMEGAKIGIFHLFFAKVEGRRIAAHACFDIGNRREYFFSGRTPELEDLRAGKLLVMHTVQDAIAKGFKFYDFGYGGDEYKSEFTRTHRLAKSLFLAKDGALLDLEKIFPKYEYMSLESA